MKQKNTEIDSNEVWTKISVLAGNTTKAHAEDRLSNVFHAGICTATPQSRRKRAAHTSARTATGHRYGHE